MLDKTSASRYERVATPMDRGNHSGFWGRFISSQSHVPVSPPKRFYVFSRSHTCTMHTSETYTEPFSGDGFITVLPDDRYTLLQPIPVQIIPTEDGSWIARFELANIGMSGSDPHDAKESLAYDIVDMMDIFTEEEDMLIPKLKRDLDVLRRYIRVREL